MVGCLTNVLEMQEENVPSGIGFLPWSPHNPPSMPYNNDLKFDLRNIFSGGLKELIAKSAKQELDIDIAKLIDLNSIYFAGKTLSKLSLISFVAQYITHDTATAKAGLHNITQVFNVYTSNKIPHPLFYDTTWKGIVSSAGLGDPNAEFGNTYYTDHHFHFGYLIHTAAIVALLDKEIGEGKWLDQNKHWVDALIRDVANPTESDKYFPVFRSFDWFTGKSWATGLRESADGKDEESSSEDYHFAYGMKMWARVCGDAAMEARANLMLAVMRRSINLYILYSSDNTVMTPQLIDNKVSGFLFENKIDYATYFGKNPEYIHGIHMLPITPISNYIRKPEFVDQEWNSICEPIIDQVNGGWKGLLMLNKALFDPNSSLEFFKSPNFNNEWLDNGLSRTWALAYAAGLL